MTNKLAFAALASAAILAGCAGMAAAQNDAEPVTDAVPAVPPQDTEAAPPGPPPMPQPVTMNKRPNATGGEALYVEYCAMCHTANGMGTGLLARRGTNQPALLEERANLPAAFVIAAARNGIGNMPAIPRGEVSDEDMQAIADYLAAGPHGGE